MPLFFNRAGPSMAGKHYIIDPLRRIDVDYIEDLIEEESYFVLHAPRQTGKTSCLLALMDHLNAQGRYQALYVNIEPAQAAREDVDMGIDTIVELIAAAAHFYLKDKRLRHWLDTQRQKYRPTGLLHACLLYTSPSPRD